MEQNILVALDDSPNAQRAVEYLARSFTSDCRVTLFSVIPDTAALCEMNSPELTPYFHAQQSSFCVLEEEKRKLVEAAMQAAREQLIKAGFAARNILVKVETKKGGIARDIVREAQSGYDLVVLGRRGLSGIKEYFLGSISQKVISLAKEVSILIVN